MPLELITIGDCDGIVVVVTGFDVLSVSTAPLVFIFFIDGEVSPATKELVIHLLKLLFPLSFPQLCFAIRSDKES